VKRSRLNEQGPTRLDIYGVGGIIDVLRTGFPPEAYASLEALDRTSPTVTFSIRSLNQKLTPVLGLRPDTQCATCLLWGHDHRYTKCPVTLIRKGLDQKEPTVNMDALKDLIASRNFWSGMPDEYLALFKVKVGPIMAVVGDIMALKDPASELSILQILERGPDNSEVFLNDHDQIQQIPDSDDSGVFLNDHDQIQQTLDSDDDSGVFLSDHDQACYADVNKCDLDMLNVQSPTMMDFSSQSPAVSAQSGDVSDDQAQQPSIPLLGKLNTEIIPFGLLQEVMTAGYAIPDGNDLLFDHRKAPVPLVMRVLPFMHSSE
jgi:hypothetical protein